jgi:hypothetical protein
MTKDEDRNLGRNLEALSEDQEVRVPQRTITTIMIETGKIAAERKDVQECG